MNKTSIKPFNIYSKIQDTYWPFDKKLGYRVFQPDFFVLKDEVVELIDILRNIGSNPNKYYVVCEVWNGKETLYTFLPCNVNGEIVYTYLNYLSGFTVLDISFN